MELFLQFGYGMMEHCRQLINSWGSGTVILSPRDLTKEQIKRLGSQITQLGGKTLIDPQFYDPYATHHRLCNHDYWPYDFDTSILIGGHELNHLLKHLLKLNTEAHTERFIIPGIYSERINDDWLAIQSNVIDESASIINNMPRIATICISGESLRYEEQIEIVINSAEKWDVDGFYIVPEHPSTQYLVDDPMWLSNLLALCSGLKLLNKNVIVGYCNHQMLCLASSKTDAIASGTWLNVRSFSPDKFQASGDDEISRRVTWYYCPHALSEFKIPFLDMAFRSGILDLLKSDSNLESNYANILFSGAQPTSTDYSEQKSHRHYLQCLRGQCEDASRNSFSDTVDAHLQLIDRADSIIFELHKNGVLGQDRDFQNISDVNRSALTALKDTRGFLLDRLW